MKKFIIVALIISFSSIGGAMSAEAAKTNTLAVTLEETNSVPIHPPVG